MSGEAEERELDKLRKTIEEYRVKAERSGIVLEEDKHQSTSSSDSLAYNDSGIWHSPPAYPPPSLPAGRQCTNLEVLSPNSSINKRVSSGSICSMSSHASHSSMSSASSGGSNDSDQKQTKKKRWLPLKTFSKTSRQSQSSSTADCPERNDFTLPSSPTLNSQNFQNHSHGISLDSKSYNEVKRILQEKDRKLTDSKLEALTMQHRMHQLHDQITQMQHEMELLRMENEKLQVRCDIYEEKNAPLNSRFSPTKSLPLSYAFDYGVTGDPTITSQNTFGQNNFDYFKLCHAISPGSEDEGLQMKFKILSPPENVFSNQPQSSSVLTIGSIPVSRRASWEELDSMANDIVQEYCKCIDGEHKLGLVPSSISFYKVGEQTRVPGKKPPELLPCAFIVGDVDSVEIALKDASCGCSDFMALKSLIPKKVLDHYIKVLLQKKRVMLFGPSGTGKSALAHSLANHVLTRDRLASKEQAIYIFDVKQKGEEELKSEITKIAEQLESSTVSNNLPRVIIIENCFLLTSLQNIFQPLTKLSKDKNFPFFIGTMLQTKSDFVKEGADFEWISCATNSIHVKNYLSRFLRRNLIESSLKGTFSNDEEFQNMLRVVTWLPFCWYQVNRCLENNMAADVTIGPRVFTSCPSDFYSSCGWFVQMWNYVIAPYIIAAIKKIRQSQQGDIDEKIRRNWEDPTEWVIESFPWNQSDMGCDNTLRLKRICNEDFNSPPVPPRCESFSSKDDSTEQFSQISNLSPNVGHYNTNNSSKYDNYNLTIKPKQGLISSDDMINYNRANGIPAFGYKHNRSLISSTKTSVR